MNEKEEFSGCYDKRIQQWREGVIGCYECDDGVPVVGDGPSWSKILFLGRNPGKAEAEGGNTFIGPAGIVLDGELERIGVNRDSLFIDNACHCHFPGDAAPKPHNYTNCRKHLVALIEILKPIIIVTMGKESLSNAFPRILWSQRGQVFKQSIGGHTALVIPIIHPGKIVRSGRKSSGLAELYQHFNIVKNYVQKLDQSLWTL